MTSPELIRIRVKADVLRKFNLSETAIQILRNHTATSIITAEKLKDKGFCEADIKILMNKWCDCRITLSRYRPKKTKIIQALNDGCSNAAVIRKFNVSAAYVRGLKRLG